MEETGAYKYLGGMWVGPEHNKVKDLIDEFGLKLMDQYDEGRTNMLLAGIKKGIFRNHSQIFYLSFFGSSIWCHQCFWKESKININHRCSRPSKIYFVSLIPCHLKHETKICLDSFCQRFSWCSMTNDIWV